MAFKVKHKRSDEPGRRPRPESLLEGQIALNNSDSTPALFLKTDREKVVRIGPCHVGTAPPDTVFYHQYTVGELWLDITNDRNKLMVWDGKSWRTVS